MCVMKLYAACLFYLLLLGLTIVSLTRCNNSFKFQGIESVTIAQKFEVGQILNLEILREKINNSDAFAGKRTVLTKVTFLVLNKKGEDFECSWRIGETINTTSNLSEHWKTKNPPLSFDGIVIDMIVDKNGAIKEFTNSEKIKKDYQNIMKFVIAQQDSSISLDEAERFTEQVMSTYPSTKELLITLNPELMCFFEMFGKTLKVDVVLKSNSDILNPLDPKKMPTNVTTRLDEIVSSIAKISVKHEPSRELPKGVNILLAKNYSFDIKENFLKEVSSELLTESEGLTIIEKFVITQKR